MNPLPLLPRRARRYLLERLERLHEALASLARRLRDGIATVIGTHVGDAVRDALQAALDRTYQIRLGHVEMALNGSRGILRDEQCDFGVLAVDFLFPVCRARLPFLFDCGCFDRSGNLVDPAKRNRGLVLVLELKQAVHLFWSKG